MSAALYSVWLSLAAGFCTTRVSKLYAAFGDAKSMYAARETQEFLYTLGRPCRRELIAAAESIVLGCKEKNIQIIPYEDELYPQPLRDIPTPPACLYLTGDPSALSLPCISGVGTRSITRYGRQAVEAIAVPLAGYGFALVSGMAHGVDAAVHEAALAAGGKTIAVLGTPINETYPVIHAELRSRIEKNGAVISEYPPDEQTSAKISFPQRNRIIAALSPATIIFEAARKSGTMITANCALDFSREVLCVPGSIFSQQSEGTNLLITQGATPVTTALEVLAAIGYESTLTEQKRKHNAAPLVFGDQKLVYDAVADGAGFVDEIAESTGLSAARALTAVSELEIEGHIESAGGRLKTTI